MHYYLVERAIRTDDEISEAFCRKPGSWDDVNANTVRVRGGLVEYLPVYQSSDILMNGSIAADFTITPNEIVFVLVHKGQSYLVNTEGYDYARYIARLED